MSIERKSHELSDIVRRLKDHIKTTQLPSEQRNKVPSIIEFVENKEWLGMQHYANPVSLYPAQKLLLKCFYRGSIGNENLQLDEEEIEFIKKANLINDENGNALQKWNSGEIFRELVLVWGRRSGKDFIASIIALYEAMKLLEAPGGNPYAQYDLATAAAFTILTIANSAQQAHYLFKEMRDKVLQSTYFKERLDENNMTADTMHFITPHDRERNEDLKKRGLPPIPGSVMLRSGHSNSDSLVGLSCYCLLLDEVGLYKNTSGASSGDAIYNSLAPAVKTYIRKEAVLGKDGQQKIDDNGKPVFRDVFDGKIICISSPRAKEGIFFELYTNAGTVNHRFMMRLPTWEVNPRYSKEMLLTDFPNMPEDKFRMEFGAEFAGSGGVSFFPRDSVEECFGHKGLKERNSGLPGFTYFAHLDPATSSHNYALIVCHKEDFLNVETHKRDYRVVVDHIKYWSPTPKKLISVEEVDSYVIELNNRFHLGLITYDQWNSAASLEKMRKLGIPAIETKFNRHYKNVIYDNLLELVTNKRLYIPMHTHLRNEMLNLLRKWSPGSSGYKVMPKIDGDIVTDDLCLDPDSLVWTSRGIKAIKDTILGDSVLSDQGNYCKVEVSNARPNIEPSVEICSFYGLPLRLTNSHPVQILSEDGIRIWKKAGEISVSDYLCRTFPNNEREMCFDMANYGDVKDRDEWWTKDRKYENNDEFIKSSNPNAKWIRRFPDVVNLQGKWCLPYLFGLYLAEGNISDHGVTFSFDADDAEGITTFKHCCETCFGIEPTAPYGGADGSRSRQIAINSTLIRDLFVDMFGQKTAEEKEIPSGFESAPRVWQADMLRGYFAGDGSSTDTSFTFTTVSKRMCLQVQTMLFRLGIVSSWSVSKRAGESTEIGGREVRYNYDLYNLRVTDAVSYNLLAEKWQMGARKVQSKFYRPRYKFGDGFVACQVKKLRSIRLERVCNLRVAKDSSFIAQGINVHNCDALAGACYNAMNESIRKLPQGKLAHIPVSPSGGYRNWMGPQGSMGYGTGGQIGNKMRHWSDRLRNGPSHWR